MVQRLLSATPLLTLSIFLGIWNYTADNNFWWLYLVCGVSFVWALFVLMERSFVRFFEVCLAWIALQTMSIIIGIKGYRVSVLNTDRLIQIYKLRYDVYREKGYIPENEHGILIDEFDSFSDHIVLEHNGEICGGLRIVYESPFNYPLEEYFNLANKFDNSVVEIGRWVSKKKYRKSSFGTSFVTVVIVLKTYLYLILKSKKFAIFMISEDLKDYICSLFGVDFNQVDQLPLLDSHVSARKPVTYFKKYRGVDVQALPVDIRLLVSIPFKKRNKNKKWESSPSLADLLL